MSSWSALVLALLWAGPSLLMTARAQTRECAMSEPITLVDGLFLQQVQDSVSGTFTMKLIYTGGHSWIGIGINRNGRGKMIPADAVVGRILEDDTTNVGFYHLGTDAEDASGVQPYASNTFDDTNTGFFQTTEDGTDISVLQFTQSLAEMQVTAESVWIFAVGLPDNLWGGEHLIQGSFQLPLTECVVVTSETQNPTQTTTTTVPPQTTSSSETQTNTPSDQQTTTEPTPEIMTQIDQDDEESGSILDGLNSAASSSTESDLTIVDSSSQYRGLWMAHGIILAIAWGVCAPLAIGASILRVPLKERLGQDNWFSWHLYLNMSTVLLTIIGFLLAVVAMAKEGNKHFEDEHHKFGLAVFILVICQATAGYLRPHLAAKHAPDDTTDAKKDNEVSTHKPDPSNEKSQGKTVTRQVWEFSHRLLGMCLLCLAWFNCTTGIEAQVENFEDVQDWTGVFWGITAGISGSIFLLAVVSRLGRDNQQ